MGLPRAALGTPRASLSAAGLGDGPRGSAFGDRAAGGDWLGGGLVLVGLAAVAGLTIGIGRSSESKGIHSFEQFTGASRYR